MDDNITESEFLDRLARYMNHTLLSPNKYGNISDPGFFACLAGDMNQTLEGMKEL